MSAYTIIFHYPNAPSKYQSMEVETWGGNLGSAVHRAWKEHREDIREGKFPELRKLKPNCISIRHGED